MKITRKKATILFIVLGFLNTMFLVAQEDSSLKKAKDIIGKTILFYEGQNTYNLEVQYKMYEDYESDNITENYNGVLMMNKKKFYSKIHQTETLATSLDYVKVNHHEKAMIYGKVSAKDQMEQHLQLEALFQNFQKANINISRGNYIIELVAPIITLSPYGKVILEVKKEDFQLVKQTLFLLQQYPVTTQNGVQKLTNPRLEIEFDNFSIDNSQFIEAGNIEVSNYVIKTPQGIKPANRFLNYHFIDTTNQ